MTTAEVILALVAALGWLGWWITGRFGLQLSHRHRVIEGHTEAIHGYIEKYYSPYVALSRVVEGFLDPQGRIETMKREESFFRLAQWFYLRHKWSKDIGGMIVLKDAVAETLLVSLSGFQSRFFGGHESIGMVERHALMDLLESKKRVRYFFNAFKDELNKEPLQSIFQKYEKWLSKKTKISLFVEELGCFHRLFHFEINMCYVSWYGKKPAIPKIDFTFVKGRLDKLENSGHIRSKDKKKYLRKLGYK